MEPLFFDNGMNGLRTREGLEENVNHYWAKDPSLLNAACTPGDFAIGSGHDIYDSAILPAISSAQHEVILVTCFWAPSSSLTALSSTLIALSAKHLSAPVTVRLCFSSRSISQKLFHTSSPAGYTYPSSQWVSKLHLPPPSSLRGLNLTVKSVFILPFSIMHPKFLIIDRRIALFPSCNLSHETWLECCLPLTGPIVASLFQFWYFTWGRSDDPVLHDIQPLVKLPHQHSLLQAGILLPSPHHRFPNFRPFPLSAPSAPPTPLNNYLLDILSTAAHSLKILTPNLTSPPLLSALLSALARGIHITIITNRRMMILEQLLTAGTTTELCVWRLVRDYQALLNTTTPSIPISNEEEARRTQIGILKVGYFLPTPNGQEQKLHVKCTIVDGQVVVLGSGNMDRASWFTSLELGIAIEGKVLVDEVWETLSQQLEGRVEEYFGW